ncbi:MAG: class I SAM-dependent RNA methyltransferase [Fibrobacter sp.]|nr:class I SAM-dependent RNA methyltransferase [Fibrobacter sp.]
MHGCYIFSVICELSIEKLVQGGEGLARLDDGRVCFVRGGLPGERCRVELTAGKKDFARGRVVEVLEKSADRVQPRCPLYGKCGGCSLQHLDSAKQVPYLERVERENFKRIAHQELPANFKIYQAEPWGYRNRARVVYLGEKDGRCRFGFRKQESNGVVTIENCPVLTPGLNDFLKTAKASEVFKGLKRIPKDLELNLFDDGTGRVAYYYRGMPESRRQECSVSTVKMGGKEIVSDASVFFQSNLSLLPRLVESVREAVDEGIASGAASDQWLIDLFSGVGFFAAILQDKFRRVTTVEREPLCLKYANVNLCGNEGVAGAENISAPAEEWLAKNVVDKPATLIVDPPRTGLPPEALTAIVKSSVNRLIYVSCDPVTLARDFAKFNAAGFALKRAEGFAFYPQTPHLEMMFVLAR